MEVKIHIYDVTNTPSERANSVIMTVNNLTRDVGGVFHGAVEICGKEWSFGFCESGSGVYACLPKLNPAYTYRETIEMGKTDIGMKQLNAILRKMREEWQGNTYDLLGRNCCHFCEEFCKELGLGPIPAWINRFAYGAESAVTAVQSTYDTMMWLGEAISQTWTNTFNCMLPEDPASESDELMLEARRKAKIAEQAKLREAEEVRKLDSSAQRA